MMSIGAIVGVKDEVGLISRCLDHLFRIGVDKIVVQDYGSTDGTVEAVQARMGQAVRLCHFDEGVDRDVTFWGTQEADLARSLKTDWVLLLDADEFWLPAGGSVRNVLAGVEDQVVTAPRYNVAATHACPDLPDPLTPDRYEEVPLYVERLSDRRAQLDGPDAVSWIRSVPIPKVALRPHAVSRIEAGHHAVLDGSGRIVPSATPRGLLIAHLPFSSWQRFERKINNVRASIALQQQYHSDDRGWHWKRWVSLADAGLLRQEYGRQIVTNTELARLQARGTVRFAADLLREGTEIPA